MEHAKASCVNNDDADRRFNSMDCPRLAHGGLADVDRWHRLSIHTSNDGMAALRRVEDWANAISVW